jgi:hypothetical protein
MCSNSICPIKTAPAKKKEKKDKAYDIIAGREGGYGEYKRRECKKK